MGCCYDEGQKPLCSCCQRETLVGTGKRFILQQGQREAITVCLHVPLKFNGTRSNISASSNWHRASTLAPVGSLTLSATCWSVINKASDWSTLNVAEIRFNQPLFLKNFFKHGLCPEVLQECNLRKRCVWPDCSATASSGGCVSRSSLRVDSLSFSLQPSLGCTLKTAAARPTSSETLWISVSCLANFSSYWTC